jgi:hypothetical protein
MNSDVGQGECRTVCSAPARSTVVTRKITLTFPRLTEGGVAKCIALSFTDVLVVYDENFLYWSSSSGTRYREYQLCRADVLVTCGDAVPDPRFMAQIDAIDEPTYK